MIEKIYEDTFIDGANNIAGTLIKHKSLGYVVLQFHSYNESVPGFAHEDYSVRIFDPLTHNLIQELDVANDFNFFDVFDWEKLSGVVNTQG